LDLFLSWRSIGLTETNRGKITKCLFIPIHGWMHLKEKKAFLFTDSSQGQEDNRLEDRGTGKIDNPR